MKITINNDLIIIYLYNQKLNFDDLNTLKNNIKNILINIYNRKIDLNGIYEVVIYENIYYGYILEIINIKEFAYGDFIDLKLDLKRNQVFYLVFDNYNYVEDLKEVFYKNNQFFVNIKDVSNVNKKIEFCDIVYKNINELEYNSVKIQ